MGIPIDEVVEQFPAQAADEQASGGSGKPDPSEDWSADVPSAKTLARIAAWLLRLGRGNPQLAKMIARGAVIYAMAQANATEEEVFSALSGDYGRGDIASGPASTGPEREGERYAAILDHFVEYIHRVMEQDHRR